MYLNGSKGNFAIEWELDLVEEETTYYGSIVFWIGGNMIGNVQNQCFLDTVAYQLKNFLKHKDIRSSYGSESMSAKEVFYKLHGKFFDESISNKEDSLDAGIYRAIFWLDERGDSSFRDLMKLILINEYSINKQRFIWQSYDSEEIYEFRVEINTFEVIVDMFLKDLEAEVKRITL